MSGAGIPEISVGNMAGKRVSIVASSWHEQVMQGLIEGALRVIVEAGATAELHRVPGTFELPLAAQAAAKSGADAVVALGVVGARTRDAALENVCPLSACDDYGHMDR